MGASSAFAAHDGYTATSSNCRSCHAVHGSAGGKRADGGDALFITGSKTNTKFSPDFSVTIGLNTVALEMCEYCHVAGTTHPVYQYGLTKSTYVAGMVEQGFAAAETTVSAMHQIGAATVPDATDNSGVAGHSAGLDCIDCHNALPHGRQGVEGPLYSTDVKGSFNTTETAFCQRCHDKNDDQHTSHPLVAQDGTWAYVDATDCTSCHISDTSGGFHETTATALSQKDGVTTIKGDVAFTASPYGYKSYNSTYATTIADGACLRCHVNGAGDAGVQITW
jgi:hypothetical protein